MLYINQQDHPNIPYPTNAKDPSSRSFTAGSVASSGCGLCSMMMVVDRLTLSSFSLEEARDLAVSCGSNINVGTDMRIFGKACAVRFGLTMTVSNDLSDLVDCLHNGGCAIINVGGNREGHYGVLSDVGHYCTILSCLDARAPYTDTEFCVMDPAQRDIKYIIPERLGKVREDGHFLYLTGQTLLDDTENRDPGFYLFRRIHG